jgi:hypothetical protein
MSRARLVTDTGAAEIPSRISPCEWIGVPPYLDKRPSVVVLVSEPILCLNPATYCRL